MLAFMHCQRDAVDHLLAAAAKRHIGEFQNRCHAESRYAWPLHADRQDSGIVLDSLTEAFEQRTYCVHDGRGGRRGMRRSEFDQGVLAVARIGHTCPCLRQTVGVEHKRVAAPQTDSRRRKPWGR